MTVVVVVVVLVSFVAFVVVSCVSSRVAILFEIFAPIIRVPMLTENATCT